MKKNNKKGFTLAELLIVIAIIAVLVAIAIPVFNTALTKAEHTANVANVRAAYSEAMVEAMTDGAYTAGSVNIKKSDITGAVESGTEVTFTDGKSIVVSDGSNYQTTIEVDNEVKFVD